MSSNLLTDGEMARMRKYKRRQIRRSWQLYAMLMLPVVYLLIFNYYPMLGVQIAFKEFSTKLGIWGSKWIGFSNFKRFISSYQFWPIVRNTLTLSLYSVIAMVPLPVILALSLNAVRGKKFKKTVQLLTYMPNFISTVVMVGLLKQILNPRMGLLAYVGSLLGFDMPDLFGSSAIFPHLYVWSTVWQRTGWSSIIYLSALSAVDPELHEAAMVDGASRFQRIIHIDLPVVLPTAIIMLILNMGQIMSIGFEKVLLMQTDLNLSASEIVSTYVYKVGLTGKPDYSYSTAVNLFNSMINLFLISVTNLFSKKTGGTGLF